MKAFIFHLMELVELTWACNYLNNQVLFLFDFFFLDKLLEQSGFQTICGGN